MFNYLRGLALQLLLWGIVWCSAFGLLAVWGGQLGTTALEAFATGFLLGAIPYAALVLSMALLAGVILLIGNELHKLKSLNNLT